jgi:hypothetical protein
MNVTWRVIEPRYTGPEPGAPVFLSHTDSDERGGDDDGTHPQPGQQAPGP